MSTEVHRHQGYGTSATSAKVGAEECSYHDMHYVYIIQSQKDQSFYKGFTSDLKKQLAKHNQRGQKYTSSKAPFSLVW
ncbi:MAG: GIY-YIG nuclease family protein, partial [Patescibacteria group bacterium]